MEFLNRVSRPGTSTSARLFRAMWRQQAHAPVCPAEPRLDGRLARVTDGNAGIGREIAAGLAARGAEVVIAARGDDEAREVANPLTLAHGVTSHGMRLDLSDLESVEACVRSLQARLEGRAIDFFVQHAGFPLHGAVGWHAGLLPQQAREPVVCPRTVTPVSGTGSGDSAPRRGGLGPCPHRHVTYRSRQACTAVEPLGRCPDRARAGHPGEPGRPDAARGG